MDFHNVMKYGHLHVITTTYHECIARTHTHTYTDDVNDVVFPFKILVYRQKQVLSQIKF